MNKIFKGISWLLFVLTTSFLLLPFLSVAKKGWRYLVTFPYEIEIQKALILTMKASVLSSFLCTGLCLLMCNELLYGSQKIKTACRYLYSLPMGIPHLVSGIALLLFFGQNGIGGFLLENFGVDFVYQQSGVYLAMLFINIPFSITTLETYYNKIDGKMIFTARSLGADEWKTFIYVVVPSLKKELLALTIMNWSRAVGEFGVVMMLVGITRMKTETLATSIFLNISTGDTDIASGLSLLLIIISVLTVSIFKWIEGKG